MAISWFKVFFFQKYCCNLSDICKADSGFATTSDKVFANDFYLFKFAKHFIVGPSSYHWWGAWLNENKNKICLRPANLNPSNNKKFWPDKWINI